MFWLHVMVEFTKLNPIGYVPALVHGDMVLADSFAIIMVFVYHYQFINFFINHQTFHFLNLHFQSHSIWKTSILTTVHCYLRIFTKKLSITRYYSIISLRIDSNSSPCTCISHFYPTNISFKIPLWIYRLPVLCPQAYSLIKISL